MLEFGLTPLSKNEAGNSGIVSGSGADVISGSELEILVYKLGFVSLDG